MAPTGTKRQKSWDHHNWLRLLLKAWKHSTLFHKYFPQDDDQTPVTPLIHTFKDYRASPQNKYLHLHACARAYITYVLRPEKQEERQCARAARYKKEMKGKLRFWMRYTLRELQHRRQIEARQQHRINKISSRTRNINQKDRKNLSEYKWTCQHRVTADTKYEGLHRWPQRDKIGRQLRIYITYITTQAWPR